MTRYRIQIAILVGLAVLTTIGPLGSIPSGHAESVQPANESFQETWERTDQPVLEGAVDRTWMWGPSAKTVALVEPYAGAPDGERVVQYFDKSRMEINDPSADASDPWHVTNGLLARDLMTGRVQVGDDQFEHHQPAEIPVAGDVEDQNAPTYATFNQLRDQPPRPDGSVIDEVVNRAGEILTDSQLQRYGVTEARHVPQTGHNVASVFWDYMNSSGTISESGTFVHGDLFPNPFYATGFPLAPAYWSTVLVDDEPRDVLMQVFQRRVLTYTPVNPEGWQVEAGNIGLHYYHWVYDVLGKSDHGHPAGPGESGVLAACLDDHEAEFLQLINDYRETNGLDRLENSAALNIASHNHSADMAERDYLAHVSPDGTNPWDRMVAAGYDYNTSRAENLAAGQYDAATVFEAWRTSSGHNENMLSSNVSAIGIGRVEASGSQYSVYWTTKFGGVVDAAPDC